MGAITKWSFLLFSSVFFVATLQAQYPATGNKQRLGWQTTGDGLVYRGAIADTSTLDPSGLNNAWMLLDTVSGNLYAYRIKAWRLVSGGGGVSMPFDSVTFNINEGDASEQELKYSADKGYLQYGGLDSVQIPLLPGIWYVRNDTSVTIPKGTVVRATGTLGASGRIKVKHMIANGTIPAMYVLGIAMQDIATGADGYVMTQGKIRQVNTTAYSEGAVLYADVDTLGGLTQTEPGNGYLKLPIAFVVHSASNGTLAVRIDPGSSLHDLHDVDTTGRVNGSVLQYDSALKYWKASTTAGIVAGDTSVFARDWQIAGTANYLPKFTGASSIGNSPILNVADNQLVVGHNAVGTGAKNVLEIRGTGNTDLDGSKVDLYVNSSGQDYHSPIVSLRRSRGATAGAFTKAEYNDWLGQLLFNGADGDEYTGGAGIRAVVDSVTGNNDMPASLYFLTTPNGSSSLTTRMTINNAGRVGIGTTTPSRSLHVDATDAIRIPVGNTSQRTPSGVSSASGDIRYSNEASISNLEWYDGANWRQPVISASATGLGTAGRVFYSDADGLASTGDSLFWTQQGNKLGIGISPTPNLHIHNQLTNPALWLTGGTVTQPFTAVGFIPEINANTTATWAQRNVTSGGMQLNAFTANVSSNNIALELNGHVGESTPSSATIAAVIRGWKSNGTTGRTAMTGSDKVLRVAAGTASLIEVQGDGKVGIGTTSPTELLDVSGTVRASKIGVNIGTPTPRLQVHDSAANAALWLTGGQLSQPFTAVGFVPEVTAQTAATWAQRNVTSGGMQLNAFTANGNSNTIAAEINGHVGATSLNSNAFAAVIRGWKSNGTTGRTAMTGSDKVLRVAAGTASLIEVQGNGNTGFGVESPTARIHLAAGTSSANTAPLKFTSGTNLTTAEAGAVEWNGTNLFITTSTPTRQTVNQGLTASTYLQFGSTAAQTSKDLTVTVTGASEGDVVSLGVPNGAVHANSCYTAWVSAANTVTIRFNNYSSAQIDPLNYEFKVFVTKF